MGLAEALRSLEGLRVGYARRFGVEVGDEELLRGMAEAIEAARVEWLRRELGGFSIESLMAVKAEMEAPKQDVERSRESGIPESDARPAKAAVVLGSVSGGPKRSKRV